MTATKKYYIGISDKPDEYKLYCYSNNQMIFIRKYDNPKDAMADLNKYSLIGTTDRIGLELFNQIFTFVEKDINLHEFIMSLFVTFKYTDTVEFQQLVNIINEAGDPNSNNFRQYLTHLINCVYPGNKELLMYISLYDYFTTISPVLNIRNLYDPSSQIVAISINHILKVFEYDGE